MYFLSLNVLYNLKRNLLDVENKKTISYDGHWTFRPVEKFGVCELYLVLRMMLTEKGKRLPRRFKLNLVSTATLSSLQILNSSICFLHLVIKNVTFAVTLPSLPSLSYRGREIDDDQFRIDQMINFALACNFGYLPFSYRLNSKLIFRVPF